MHNPWPKFPKAKDTKNTSIIKKLITIHLLLIKTKCGWIVIHFSPCTYYEPNNVKYKKLKAI